MHELLSVVRPGSGLFVYPYMPLLYFLTQAENPTRFSVHAARNDDAKRRTDRS